MSTNTTCKDDKKIFPETSRDLFVCLGDVNDVFTAMEVWPWQPCPCISSSLPQSLGNLFQLDIHRGARTPDKSLSDEQIPTPLYRNTYIFAFSESSSDAI